MHWTHIEDRMAGDIVVLDVKGHMTLAEPESLLFAYVSKMMQEEGQLRFVVNLRDLTFIDSVGIGEIVRSYTHLSRHGGMLKLCAVGPRVREVLEVTHLDSIIRMFDTEADALQSFGG